jgi:hypothetical protein
VRLRGRLYSSPLFGMWTYTTHILGEELQEISQPLRHLSAVTSLAMTYIRVEAAAAEAFMSALA